MNLELIILVLQLKPGFTFVLLSRCVLLYDLFIGLLLFVHSCHLILEVIIDFLACVTFFLMLTISFQKLVFKLFH